MKIEFSYEKKNWIGLGIAAAVGILMYIATRYHIWAFFIYMAVMFAITNLKFTFSKDHPMPWLWTLVLFIPGSILTTFCVQILIIDPEGWLIYRSEGIKQFYNVLIALAVYFFFLAVFNRPTMAATTAHIILVALAYVDYYVYLFRGNEITVADVATVDTGISVAAEYHWSLHDRGALVIMLSIIFCVLLHKFREVRFKNKWLYRVIGAVVFIVLIHYVLTQTDTLETQTWERHASEQEGFMLNFLMSIRDSFVSEPDGYSEETIADLEKKYGDSSAAVQNVTTNKDVKDPTIIVIMDESFADLSVLGNMTTNIGDYMPFIHSMSENTIKGYALSSVFGAKTPNSEWEMQTGNSMAFLPAGSVAYQQYMRDDPTSIVSTLKNDGYTAVAMHPYLSTGWRRNTVYPKLGFDEKYFLDDPSGYFDETKTLRKYVTDQELFDKIIDRYKQKKDDEKLYILGVTMQNHGGYDDYYPNFDTSVRYQSMLSFPDVDQYLTCANATDTAVKNLITYFQGVDDPVEIVFFGDHQPSLDSGFYQTLNGKGMSGLTMDELEDFFKVPFFIWTNYDSDAVTYECTSFNYLSTLALERANIELPPYNVFLSNLMEKIPAMNARGYYSESLGRFIHYEDATGEEAEWLDNYNILEYNGIFGKKNTSSVFFPYIKSDSVKSGSSEAAG